MSAIRVRFFFIAKLAIQGGTDEFFPSLSRDYPGPVHPRRIMANVLSVAAVQISHPVQSFILMKTSDPAFHAVMLARKKPRSRRAKAS
jgi:hypothetical protein